jgi:phosphopantothenoylcysteine decarboxylase/phosphopantothenate--cysteine ligase
MTCLVTAGPTYEPLDQVRRLTNFSTGRLGTELANFLVARGHEATLLIGEAATWCGQRQVQRVETFTTTANLRERLRNLAARPVDALFHAAAVSDFSFGKVWSRSPKGELIPVSSGKLSTRQGALVAELVPTPKIIGELRAWFPRTQLVGWKYEVEGGREAVIRLAESQIKECRTDACVVNGPGYGSGFGVVTSAGKVTHLPDGTALYEALELFIRTAPK